MKKIYIILLSSILALLISVCFVSCSDNFLNENYSTGYLTNYFEDEEGLNALAISLYANIRYHFAYEWAYGFTLYGCDEFSTGGDLLSEPWNIYDPRLGPKTQTTNVNTPSPENLWDQMYFGISSANAIIANENVFTTESVKNQCLGEAYLLRAYNYFRLVSQYGNVVLITEPIEGVQRYFKLSTPEETTQLIIDDLSKAYDLLPEAATRGTGTWVKATAGHFLAKALLFRCSERNDAWNSSYKDTDLQRIITVCDYVIAARPLAADFRDLWNWTDIDCETEKNPEFLMVALFNGDASTSGRYQNQTYPYFTTQFSNWSSWVQRGAYVGLDYQRCHPTEYNYKTYDKVNDSRFWKSFKTTYNANKIGGGGYNTEIGDLAILFIINDKNDNRFDNITFGQSGVSEFIDPQTGKDIPNAFVHYKNGQWQEYGRNIFSGITKHEDGSRTGEKGTGNRDGVLARTGETYLIKAEALVRQKKYQEAITVVNELRKRAEYKEGEDRSVHTDGTQAFRNNPEYSKSSNATLHLAYSEVNSYYLSTGIPETTKSTNLQIASYTKLPAEDEEILAELGCSDDYDRMLNFIMNERTRELNGEFLRWEDLSRTKLLLRRGYAYNKELAAQGSLSEYHLLRPIPLSFIDGLQNEDGSGLTEEQRRAFQNPGY